MVVPIQIARYGQYYTQQFAHGIDIPTAPSL
jgi:hypothetical protein